MVEECRAYLYIHTLPRLKGSGHFKTNSDRIKVSLGSVWLCWFLTLGKIICFLCLRFFFFFFFLLGNVLLFKKKKKEKETQITRKPVGPHHSMAWWRSTPLLECPTSAEAAYEFEAIWNDWEFDGSNFAFPLGIRTIHLCLALDQFPITVVVHSWL